MRSLLLLALALPGAAASPLLVAVVPDLPGASAGDEAFAVAAAEPTLLDGFTVSDGEGSFAFPAGTVVDAGRWAWATGNATAWAAHGGGPAVSWEGAAAGRFRLANGGDGLQILDSEGRAVDGFAWGDGAAAGISGPVAYASPGLVHRRAAAAEGGFRDCDCPDDWVGPRLHRVGESDLERPTFTVDRLTLYASPDSSFEALTGLIAGAHERLHLHVYELRSPPLVDALVAARATRPGLDLQALVEGAPVGLDAGERHQAADALRRIEAAGGAAWVAGNGRYGYHHLKVLVADDAVAVQSENWVESGVPQDPSWGNRGWGAIVHDAAAADWFAGWMAADRAAWDVERFDLAAFDPLFSPPPRYAPLEGGYSPRVPSVTLEGTFRVTPVVSPDHTFDPAADPVAALAASARGRLWVEELDLRASASNALGWSGPDPLHEAILAANRSGADVRVLAAAPFSPDDDGNAEALTLLAAAGVEARLLDRPGIAALHNKGLIADDAVALGSLNGNHHSRSQNREVALLLEGPGVAGFYAALFASDWDPPPAPRDGSVIADDLEGLPAAPWPTLLAGLLVAALHRRA